MAAANVSVIDEGDEIDQEAEYIADQSTPVQRRDVDDVPSGKVWKLPRDLPSPSRTKQISLS